MSIFQRTSSPKPWECLAAGVLLFAAVAPTSRALDIVFDYTYDTANFFGSAGSDQRLALEEAASFFETNLVDNLDAITPGDGNTWSAVFFDPANSGSNISVSNLTIAADTLLIYVGAEDRGPGNLGLAAPGGYNITAVTTEFLDAVTTRGETGMTTGTPNDDTDFGTWGGAVSFNNNAAINWNFDAFSEPEADEFDLLSTAIHEISHVFGFSTAESFTSLINGSNEFTGTNAVAEHGGLVPLTLDSHVDNSVTSNVFGTAVSQVPLMAESLGVGERQVFTELDVAVLEDTGWEVVPEPGSALLVFGGCGALLLRRRRRETDELEEV